jgi:hypothetical protein
MAACFMSWVRPVGYFRARGFLPRSVRELDDGGQPRIEKLYSLISECRYGIHDFSRAELNPDH